MTLSIFLTLAKETSRTSGGDLNGLRSRTPRPVKSEVLRVTTMRPWTRAVAARATSHRSLCLLPRSRVHSATTGPSIGIMRSQNVLSVSIPTRILRAFRFALPQGFGSPTFLEQCDHTQPEVRVIYRRNPLLHILMAAAFELTVFIKQIKRHGMAFGSTSPRFSSSSNAPASAKAAKVVFRLLVG